MLWYSIVWYGMAWYGMVWYVCMYMDIQHISMENGWNMDIHQ